MLGWKPLIDLMMFSGEWWCHSLKIHQFFSLQGLGFHRGFCGLEQVGEKKFWRFYQLFISEVHLNKIRNIHTVHMCVSVCVRDPVAALCNQSLRHSKDVCWNNSSLPPMEFVSSKRWQGRKGESELGKNFSLCRCNQQCSPLQSLK